MAKTGRLGKSGKSNAFGQETTMARYRIEDSIVDTENATFSHKCKSVAGGYGRVTYGVYRSRRGRWYKETWHSWAVDSGDLDYAEWISPEEAARLLFADGAELPEYPELKAAAENVIE